MSCPDLNSTSPKFGNGITGCGVHTYIYSVESGGEVKMTKQEIIEMIERAGFDPVERDTVYNRVPAG